MFNNWIFPLAVALNAAFLSFNIWLEGWVNYANAIVFVNLILLFLWRMNSDRVLRGYMEILDVNARGPAMESAIRRQIKQDKEAMKEMRLMLTSVNEIGQDKFSLMLNSVNDRAIRDSLTAANEKFIALRRKENENSWITSGVAAIAMLKHKSTNISDYCYDVICSVVRYLNVNQGVFFLLRDQQSDPHFELAASYAYGKRKYYEKRINPGDGMLGQVYFEKKVLHLTDIPKDHVRITSGLGEALPRSICLVPLCSDGVIYGAIELASFTAFGDAEIEYLTRIGETIGYNLSAIETHKRTEELLHESQKMAREVKVQEEELRENMAVLTSTQEEMKRKSKELEAVMSSLSTIELDRSGLVVEANPVFLSITGYSSEDIEGKEYRRLIPQQGNDQLQYDMMWNSILSGRSFSGEFRIIGKNMREIWMAGNFTPILNELGQPYKIMVISLFTTQDKEKLAELQDIFAALKHCFPMAELNPDLTLKTANELFMEELGLKRLELKKMTSSQFLSNGSDEHLQKFFSHTTDLVRTIDLSLKTKTGLVKKFATTVVKIGASGARERKGLMILRNPI